MILLHNGSSIRYPIDESYQNAMFHNLNIIGFSLKEKLTRSNFVLVWYVFRIHRYVAAYLSHLRFRFICRFYFVRPFCLVHLLLAPLFRLSVYSLWFLPYSIFLYHQFFFFPLFLDQPPSPSLTAFLILSSTLLDSNRP